MTIDSGPTLLLANSSADREGVDAAAEVLRERWAVEVLVTNSPDECEEVIDGRAHSRIVLAGGDGTLSTTVGVLWRRRELSDVELGLVALGTGNDLARGLGLPLDPTAAARAVLDSAARPMDLLVDDLGRVVVNAVHAGVGAVAAETSEPYKDALGPAAYPLGAVLAGLSYDARPISVTVDDRLVHDGPALLVAVGNGPTVGGGAPLVPGARPDDGLLDVVVVGDAPAGGRVALARALRLGKHAERDEVVQHRGHRVRIRGSALPYDADGELLEPRDDATYEVVPDAWLLRAPAGSGASAAPASA